MMLARSFNTPADAYIGVVADLLMAGEQVWGRTQDTKELLGYSFSVKDPATVLGLYAPHESRRLNPAIGALEALQLVGQVSLPEVHVARVGVFENWLDHGIFEGAYGQRVHGQLRHLVANLGDDLTSRQAVLSIYDARRDLNAESMDIPCTLTLQFFVRRERLIMRTSMRSNDAWRGLPYDMTQFIALQAAVAADLGLPLGEYQHTVGSMHLYESDWRDALVLANSEAQVVEPEDELFPVAGLDELSRWARLSLVDPTSPHEGETKFQTWLRQSTIKNRRMPRG